MVSMIINVQEAREMRANKLREVEEVRLRKELLARTELALEKNFKCNFTGQ